MSDVLLRHALVRTALVLAAASTLTSACASKPTARRTAAAPAAATYKVGATGAALSAAADDPAVLARVQRERGVQARSAAPGAPRAAAQARSARADRSAARPRTGAAHAVPAFNPAQPGSEQSASVQYGAAPSAAGPVAAQTPVSLQSLTLAAEPAARAARAAGSEPSAGDLAVPAASLRTALYVLAGLALFGMLALGLAALLAQVRGRRRAREAMASAGGPAAANDWSPPRPVSSGGRTDPPPPRVTILAAGSR